MQLVLINEGAPPYSPAGHGSGVDEPATQNEPGGHGRVHASARPRASLNVPAEQLVHSAAAPRLNLPLTHWTAVGVTEPAGHA